MGALLHALLLVDHVLFPDIPNVGPPSFGIVFVAASTLPTPRACARPTILVPQAAGARAGGGDNWATTAVQGRRKKEKSGGAARSLGAALVANDAQNVCGFTRADGAPGGATAAKPAPTPRTQPRAGAPLPRPAI